MPNETTKRLLRERFTAAVRSINDDVSEVSQRLTRERSSCLLSGADVLPDRLLYIDGHWPW